MLFTVVQHSLGRVKNSNWTKNHQHQSKIWTMQHVVMKMSEKLADVDRDGRKDIFFYEKNQQNTHASHKTSKLIGI